MINSDLGLMYKLCERVENGLSNLRKTFENHVCEKGLAAIAAVADAVQNVIF